MFEEESIAASAVTALIIKILKRVINLESFRRKKLTILWFIRIVSLLPYIEEIILKVSPIVQIIF